MVITPSTVSGAGNKAVSGRQVRRADVAQVWHREGFRVQVRYLYSVLMKLESKGNKRPDGPLGHY